MTVGPDGAAWFTTGNDSIGRITTNVTPQIASFTPSSVKFVTAPDVVIRPIDP